MEFALYSGVVRNRKVAAVTTEQERESKRFLSFDSDGENWDQQGFWYTVRDYLSGSALFRNLNLRVHRFVFQWNLIMHLSIGTFSLMPFFFSGSRIYGCVPIAVWTFYNILFLIPTRQAEKLIANFGKLKASFKNSMEEFMTPRLLPVMSISLMLVTLSLGVTGRRLGGPPLCYRPCSECLATWDNAVPVSVDAGDPYAPARDPFKFSCGYFNGKELMGFYAMSQTSFLLFTATIAALAGCLAWKVANEEVQERLAAEAWLKAEDPRAFKLREEMIKLFGPPGDAIRPEANALWVVFGIVAALTFTLLGWHNWYVLPPSQTATLLILLNILTILMSTLMLHLGFFGRLLALYKRNFLRVEYLTNTLERLGASHVDEWWNCRNFVLNDDLALDYDIGGLAVSLTFILDLVAFFVLIMQLYEYGFSAILTTPGSYCAYACLYLTMCLIKIFTLATSTFEEQHAHIATLQALSQALLRGLQGGLGGGSGSGNNNTSGIINNPQSGSGGEMRVNQSSHYSRTNNNGQSGGVFYPVSQDHADYTVEDYGAYYELSPRHGNAPTLPNGSGSGSGEASAGSSGDVQGQGGKLPLSAGGTPGVNINPGSGLVHSTSYSLYGYGISDEYGEIYAGLSVEQREEERLRDAAYEQEKERDRLRTLSQEHDSLLDMFRKKDIHVNVTPSKLQERGATDKDDDEDESATAGSGGGSAAERDYAALMTSGKLTTLAPVGEERERIAGSNITKPPGLNIPGGISSRKTTPRSIHSTTQAGGTPRAIKKKTLDPMDPLPVSAAGAGPGPGPGSKEASMTASSLYMGATSSTEATGTGTGTDTANEAGKDHNDGRDMDRVMPNTESEQNKTSGSGFGILSYLGFNPSRRDKSTPKLGLKRTPGSLNNLSLSQEGRSGSSGDVESMGAREPTESLTGVVPIAGANRGSGVDITTDQGTLGASEGGGPMPMSGGVAHDPHVTATKGVPLEYHAYSRPVLDRNISANAGVESKRQTLAEVVSQIRKYDPYPCILGIPVMPALFQTSKFYIFIAFVLIGSRVMVSCMRIILD